MRLRRGAAQPPRRGSCPGQVGACSTHVTQHPQGIPQGAGEEYPQLPGSPPEPGPAQVGNWRTPWPGGGQGGRAQGEGIQLLCQLEKKTQLIQCGGYTSYWVYFNVGGWGRQGGVWKLRVPDNIQGSPMPLPKSLPPSQPSYFLQPRLLCLVSAGLVKRKEASSRREKIHKMRGDPACCFLKRKISLRSEGSWHEVG